MLILREILDPKYGMFMYVEESRRLWFNDTVSNLFILVLNHSCDSLSFKKMLSEENLL